MGGQAAQLFTLWWQAQGVDGADDATQWIRDRNHVLRPHDPPLTLAPYQYIPPHLQEDISALAGAADLLQYEALEPSVDFGPGVPWPGRHTHRPP